MPLSDRAIRNFKPQDRPYKKGDSGGLFMLVTPTGARWWRLKYRFGGKSKLLSLGTYPEVLLAEARERRDDARKLLAQGVDPSAQRKADKRAAALRDAQSFKAVASEWYAKHSRVLAERSAFKTWRRLEADLFPDLGHLPIGEIEPPALLAAVRKVEARGAHDMARRVLSVAGQVFRYGVATGRCTRDPTRDLRGALAPHKVQHQPAIKQAELPALLRTINGYALVGERKTALALRLLCLTFTRTVELIGATWNEFDLDGDAPTWEVPADRMKMRRPHVVPLSRQAVEILRELRAISGGSRYVLPGRDPDKSISNNTMLRALHALGYKGRHTGHGFRALASTTLHEAGFPSAVIEAQLAHQDRDTTRRAYNRAEYLPERRAMMQQWADMVDAYARGADVVPIKRRAGTKYQTTPTPRLG